jgi:predicted dehydrogenase
MKGIGIIGAGFWGRRHADVIRKMPGMALIGASRTNRAELEKFCDDYHAQAYSDHKDLLNNERIDAVVICAPHHLHSGIAIDAARAGKHILLEKPMAHTVADCMTIIQAADTAKVQLMIGHNARFFRSSIVGKSILESGELGAPVLGRSTAAKVWMTENRRSWHLKERTGGGMLMTVGIHFIDMLSWLFNSRVSSVRAHVSTAFHQQPTDDLGLLFLQYENGLTGTVTNIGYTSGVAEFSTEITCENGALKIDQMGTVHIGQKEKWRKIPESEVQDPELVSLYNEWLAFEKLIDEGGDAPVSGDYGLHMVEIIAAAKRSSTSNCEIMMLDMAKLRDPANDHV